VSSPLESNVALLVAALDLKVVQLIRDAIRVTDLSDTAGGGGDGTGIGPAATFEPRRHYEPTPVFEPRRHIHPTPVYEPREIRHLRPRYVEPPCDPAPCPPVPCPDDRKPEQLLPPWKRKPLEKPEQPVRQVKVIRVKPDIVRKGSLVDLFF
jgi:hypothetical protein